MRKLPSLTVLDGLAVAPHERAGAAESSTAITPTLIRAHAYTRRLALTRTLTRTRTLTLALALALTLTLTLTLAPTLARSDGRAAARAQGPGLRRALRAHRPQG